MQRKVADSLGKFVYLGGIENHLNLTEIQNSVGSGQRLADGSKSTRNKLQVSKKFFKYIWTIFWSEISDRTLWLHTQNQTLYENSTLSVQPKCPIRNFWSKNRSNVFEKVLWHLKFVPGRFRAIGEPLATPDWILNFGQIEVIFNSPLSIRTYLNCPLLSFAFFVLCLRICVTKRTKSTTRYPWKHMRKFTFLWKYLAVWHFQKIWRKISINELIEKNRQTPFASPSHRS